MDVLLWYDDDFLLRGTGLYGIILSITVAIVVLLWEAFNSYMLLSHQAYLKAYFKNNDLNKTLR